MVNLIKKSSQSRSVVDTIMSVERIIVMDIKIAVCDDEVEICALLEMMLIDIFRDKGMSCEAESFYTGESLCKEFERRKYDLIFLDIEMDGKSGIDVGRFLRDELGNETVPQRQNMLWNFLNFIR